MLRRARACGEGRAEARRPSLYFSGGSEAPWVEIFFSSLFGGTM